MSDISRLQEYEVLEPLGHGSFGKVSKIRRREDGKILVWKVIKYGHMTDKEREYLVNEVNILRKLHHPYIVRYHDHIHDRSNKTVYMMMEYCEGGDLAAVLGLQKLTGDHFDEEWVWRLLAQLVLALHHCHSNPEGMIIHRDIKPSNVFLDADLNARLGDFGLARMISSMSEESDSPNKTFCGTPYYMAPEQMQASDYNDRADIWALGCLIYEVCCLDIPFDGTNQKELSSNILSGQCTALPSCYSLALGAVVTSMLVVKPSERPSAQHLANVHEVSLYIREMSINSQQDIVNKREDDIASAEKMLSERLAEVIEREELVKEKECDLQAWERNLRTNERTIAGLAKRRELELDERERLIAEREAALLAREVAGVSLSEQTIS
eukprot:Ihof_evm1s520 gene=Ihof_evmTU1s520